MFKVVMYLLAFTAKSSLQQLEFRIRDGHEIDITDAPYQVAIVMQQSSLCGGVIVGPNTVLTAAHCVGFGDVKTSDFKVRAGTSFRNTGGTVHAPTLIQCHPQSDIDTPDSNIAVMYIEPPFQFDNTTQPINISIKEPEPGEMATVSGWGRLPDTNPKSPFGLMSVTVPVREKTTCLNTSIAPMDNIDRNFCVGTLYQGPCGEDQGGPVVIDGYLVGLMANHVRCSRRRSPAVGVSLASVEINKWLQQAL